MSFETPNTVFTNLAKKGMYHFRPHTIKNGIFKAIVQREISILASNSRFVEGTRNVLGHIGNRNKYRYRNRYKISGGTAGIGVLVYCVLGS